MAHFLRCVAALLACSLLFGLGCGQVDDVKLFPVTGTVKLKNGNPVGKAIIQCAGASASELTINGLTDDDGKFALSTTVIKSGRKSPGAPAGQYDVTVTMPLADNQTGGQVIKLPIKLTVEATDDNQLPITIEPKERDK